MAIIQAKLTDDARKYWSVLFGGRYRLGGSTAPSITYGAGVWNPKFSYFRAGEGGWINAPTQMPRTPISSLRYEAPTTPALQDIDAIVDRTRATSRYAASSQSAFEKALVSSDITDSMTDLTLAPNTVQVRVLLDFADYNDDGTGANPEIWELGIYSDHPDYTPLAAAGLMSSSYTFSSIPPRLLVAYGTFPKEIKDVTKQIIHYVRFTF